MRLNLYLLILSSVLFSLVHSSPIRLIIPFGASEIREVDILMLCLIGLWSIRLCLRRNPQQDHAPKLLYGLVLLLGFPLLTGIIFGKTFGTVLRDARTPLFYLGILPMLYVFKAHDDLRGLIRLIILVGVLSLVAGLIAWFRGGAYELGSVHRYGIESTLTLTVWLIFFAIACVGLEGTGSFLRKLAWTYIGFGLAFMFMGNDIRSYFVGILGALLFIAIVLYWRGRHLMARPSIRRTTALAVGLFATLMLVISFACGLGMNLQTFALQDMRLTRLYSLLDPTVGGAIDYGTGGNNRDDRLLAAVYGLKLGTRNFGLGLGYGDNDFVDLEEGQILDLLRRSQIEGNPGNTVENLLLTHNSYAWAFGRLGLWCALAYFGMVICFFYRGWRAMHRTQSKFLRMILFATLACVVFMLLLGFGGGGFFDYTGQGLILWLVILAVLVRATSLAQQA